MNRRKFLWLAGAAPVVAAGAPTIAAAALAPVTQTQSTPLVLTNLELEARRRGWLPKEEWVAVSISNTSYKVPVYSP